MSAETSQITQDLVRKIATLAKLSLSNEETVLYQSQLAKIIDSIATLSRLDVEGVPPTSSVLGLKNALREDSPALFADAQSLLENAPDRDGPYFKVPKIIEES